MKWIVIALAPLLLFACTSFKDIRVSAEDIPTPVLPLPAPLMLLETEWYPHVGESTTGVCMTPQNYENLSINTQEITRYIEQLRKNNEYLRKQLGGGQDSD